MTISESVRLAFMSYRFFIAHLGPFLRLAVPWSILGGLIESQNESFVTPLANLAVLAFGSTLISIAWHRAILLDEKLLRLRAFGGREWRYYLVSIVPTALIAGFAFLVVILWMTFSDIREMTTEMNWVSMPIMALAITAAWIVAIAPLLLVFPAIAIEDRGLGLRWSLRTSRAIMLPIFVGTIIACLPALIMDVFATPDNVGGPSDWIDVAVTFVASAVSALISFVGDVTLAGFASYLYREVKQSA